MHRHWRNSEGFGLRRALADEEARDVCPDRLLRHAFWGSAPEQPVASVAVCTSLLEFRALRSNVTSSNPKHPK